MTRNKNADYPKLVIVVTVLYGTVDLLLHT